MLAPKRRTRSRVAQRCSRGPCTRRCTGRRPCRSRRRTPCRPGSKTWTPQKLLPPSSMKCPTSTSFSFAVIFRTRKTARVVREVDEVVARRRGGGLVHREVAEPARRTPDSWPPGIANVSSSCELAACCVAIEVDVAPAVEERRQRDIVALLADADTRNELGPYRRGRPRCRTALVEEPEADAAARSRRRGCRPRRSCRTARSRRRLRG